MVDEPRTTRFRKRKAAKPKLSERFFPRLPQPPGPFNVGVLDIEDRASKPECFGEFDIWHGQREKLVLESASITLYYPTLVEGQETREYYRPRWVHPPVRIYALGWTRVVALPPAFAWFFASFVVAFIYGIRLFSLDGAPLVPPQTRVHEDDTHHDEAPQMPEQLPVVVFSHGLFGTPRVYSELCGALASYGFVVCAVEHRDGTAPAVLLDPEKVDAEKLPYSTRNVHPKKTTTRKAYPYVMPPNMWLVGKRTPEWTDAGDSTLILRRAQLKMRVREVEEALILLNRLNDGQLQGSSVPFMGDKTGQPASLDRRTAALDQFRGRLDLTGNIAMAGHSAGGATVVEVLRALRDGDEDTGGAQGARYPFKLGILLDPWSSPLPPPDEAFVPSDFAAPHHPPDIAGPGSVPRGRLEVPILALNSTMFSNWDDVSPYTKALVEEAATYSGKGVSLEIKGSIHLSQTDFPLLFNSMLLFNPLSALKTSASRCMDLNVKATMEFLREVLPLDSLPLPEPGYECDFSKSDLKGQGITRRHQKSYLARRRERVLQGEASEVVVQFKKL